MAGPPAEVLLIHGSNRHLVCAALQQLCAAKQQPLVLILGEPGVDPAPIREAMLRQYRYAAFLKGAYAGETRHLSIDFLTLASQDLPTELPAHLPDLHSCRSVLPIPDSLALDGEDLDLVLAQPQVDALEVLQEQLGLPIDEALLQSLLSHPAAEVSLDELLALAGRNAREWLATPAADLASAWQGPIGELYRCLQDQQLWRQGLMQRDRDLLDQAIRRCQTNPDDWAAQLVMLLYKRFDPALPAPEQQPDWFRPAVADYLQTNGRHLEILPPLSDLTVSIFILTYNRLTMLPRAVQGVLSQSYPHWRLFILDHGSSDGTREYCQSLAQQDERITILRKDVNEGREALGKNHHAFLEAAQTELVMMVPDDDWLLPGHLENTMALLRERPWLGMVAGAYTIYNRQGQIDVPYGPFYPTDGVIDPQIELQRALLVGICPQGGVYRKSVLRRLAAWDVMFHSADNAYAIWDYLISTKSLGSFEVGYTRAETMGFLADEGTAFASFDWNYGLLCLVESICQDYNGLFGEGMYPATILRHFVEGILLNKIQQFFRHHLLSSSDPAAFAAAARHQARGWEKFVAVRHGVLAHSSETAPVLIDINQAYGLARQA